jgi:hypothetical protein
VKDSQKANISKVNIFCVCLIHILFLNMQLLLFISLSFLARFKTFRIPFQRRKFLFSRDKYDICAKLLEDPSQESVGNFFESENSDPKFIQCQMLALGEVDGNIYGVGYPIDTPVMLTYFEGNELIPVKEGHSDYDNIISYVANQLEKDDVQLFQTPVVLTMQGDFEDDDEPEAYAPLEFMNAESEVEEELVDRNNDNKEEMTVEDILAMEGWDDEDEGEDIDDGDELLDLDNDEEEDEDDNDEEDEDAYDDEEEDDDEDKDAYGNDEDKNDVDDDDDDTIPHKQGPDFVLFRSPSSDASTIQKELLVTKQDARLFQKAHRCGVHLINAHHFTIMTIPL